MEVYCYKKIDFDHLIDTRVVYNAEVLAYSSKDVRRSLAHRRMTSPGGSTRSITVHRAFHFRSFLPGLRIFLIVTVLLNPVR